jgi:hypothetical protein
MITTPMCPPTMYQTTRLNTIDTMVPTILPMKPKMLSPPVGAHANDYHDQSPDQLLLKEKPLRSL